MFKAPAWNPPPGARLPGLPALLLLLIASGCGEADEPARGGPAATADSAIAIQDGAGRTLTLDRPARRVVSTVPALTEWLVAMGAADRIVARTDYDTLPSLAHLPSVGGGLDPSVEWLAARRPDLVIAWPDAPSRSLITRLESLGIPVYTAPVESVEQAFAAVTDLGRLLGEPAAAATAMAEVRAGLDSVRSAVADRRAPAPSVLFLIGLDPLMAAGPGTFVDQLVREAGGRNVLDDLRTLWPQLSLEQVVRRAPDVVIVGSATVPDPAAALRRRPGWRDVPAVRAGRVFPVDPYAVNRPGPGLDEAAATLARLIHAGSGPSAGSGP